MALTIQDIMSLYPIALFLLSFRVPHDAAAAGVRTVAILLFATHPNMPDTGRMIFAGLAVLILVAELFLKGNEK